MVAEQFWQEADAQAELDKATVAGAIEQGDYFAKGGKDSIYEVGVHYHGDYQHFGDGVATAVRRHAISLYRAGLPVFLDSISHKVVSAGFLTQMSYSDLPLAIRQEVDALTKIKCKRHDVRVWHIVPTDNAIMACMFPHSIIQAGYPIEVLQNYQATTALYFAFEGSLVSKQVVFACNKAGKVWVPCSRAKTVLEACGVVEGKVRVVPHPYPPKDLMLRAVAKKAAMTRDGVLRWLTVGKWEPRKAHHELIGAFLKRPKGEQLILKTSPFAGDWKGYPNDWEASVKEWIATGTTSWTLEAFEQAMGASDMAHIPLLVIEDKISREALVELYTQADIYVSVGRSEGFDLPAFDAKLAGMPMIYVGNGGTEDFASELDQCICWTGMEPVHPDYSTRGACFGEWAAFGVDEIGAAMERAAPLAELPRVPFDKPGFSAVEVGKAMRADIEELADKVETDMRGIDIWEPGL